MHVCTTSVTVKNSAFCYTFYLLNLIQTVNNDFFHKYKYK